MIGKLRRRLKFIRYFTLRAGIIGFDHTSQYNKTS